MKAGIEVKNRKEAALIRRALEDGPTRALVLTMGALMALPDTGSRRRVLNFVADKLGIET